MEDSKTITYYNEHAEEFIENTWKADMSEVYGRFLKYMEPGAHILDAGCGSGPGCPYGLSPDGRSQVICFEKTLTRFVSQNR